MKKQVLKKSWQLCHAPTIFNMHKGFIKTAAVLGALSVIIGAFATHGLKGTISEHALSTFETGVRYLFYHVFALLAVGMLFKEFPVKAMQLAGWLFITGMILFSGSLFALAFIQAAVKPGYGWVGAVTPFGGAAFIAGWCAMCVAFFTHNAYRQAK